ncbi:unnamed protein product [Didymodactylos carnosus]|uniref:UBC core domain-containing protein n=1 Tax=Didymodactylos carnosus TaxID=1234261 RepID=A0A814C4W2_9BILA|nr:unnamed protein product [Didymodactylos carnosus]CAF0935480.1 unnamed protein product [Didymodactylos carnosus]CAF3535737.1 unnamed protein product [Didymodactylos carnosus]CAF3712777.1 unnamed protein product [Didymodactylos carnosus]
MSTNGLTTTTAYYQPTNLKTLHTASNSPSVKALSLEYQKLLKEPVEGFTVKLDDNTNLYKWHVGIFGPPDTLYAGGYYKADMEFPTTYPFAPPKVRFLTKMWHPNIYENGEVCISILHPPTEDPQSGEHASERWNPTQNVRTILMSIISLLNEPNCSSPANVDASVMYRKFKEHKDPEYETIIKKQVNDSKIVAEQEGITIPKTLDDYVAPSKLNKKTLIGGISRDDEDETDSMLGSENGNNLSENDDDEEYMEDEEDEGR